MGNVKALTEKEISDIETTLKTLLSFAPTWHCIYCGHKLDHIGYKQGQSCGGIDYYRCQNDKCGKYYQENNTGRISLERTPEYMGIDKKEEFDRYYKS